MAAPRVLGSQMGRSPPASPTAMPSAWGSNLWDAPKTMPVLRSRVGGWHEGNSTGLGPRSRARSALGCTRVTPVRMPRVEAPARSPRRASSPRFGRASLPVAYWRKQRDNSRKMKPNTSGARGQSAPKITLVRWRELCTGQEQGGARALRALSPAAP